MPTIPPQPATALRYMTAPRAGLVAHMAPKGVSIAEALIAAG